MQGDSKKQQKQEASLSLADGKNMNRAQKIPKQLTEQRFQLKKLP